MLESGDQFVGNSLVEPLGATPPARVLLIEPDPRAAMWIGEMLRATWPDGVTVAHAERLSAATQELLEEPITCVLLGDRDPLAALDQLRTAAPDAPIVLLAERDDEQPALAALAAGAQDCVCKSGLSPALLRRSMVYAIQRKKTEVKLAYQALHDPLTDLPNRALFIDRVGVALDRARRSGATLAVLFLDVDNFKHVNDSLGHYAGDRLLVELANRLRTMLRPMDTMARFGGDEFTFLFEDLASEREVVTIAERIGDAAKLPVMLDEGLATVTVSIGIAMVTDPSTPPDAVIREADAAMYRAKEHGRSRYELFDDISRRRAMERLELEAGLRQAVERRELVVYYQPSVSLSERFALSGLEALVRWRHPQRGLLAPGEFMAVAEETGLVVPIGRHVLEHALGMLAYWRERRPTLMVSVNLSYRQLEDPSLLSTLSGAIRASGIAPSKLCLEITETALARTDDAVRTLQALKALGVRLAIDDFGTGASSLTELKRLPIDTIKIHESVVGGLAGDPDEAPIVGAVVELGHALGRSVIAEGVETEAQLAQLRTLGCDGAQGFLFSRPVPEDDVERLLAPAASAGAGM